MVRTTAIEKVDCAVDRKFEVGRYAELMRNEDTFLETVRTMVALGATHADLARAFCCSMRSIGYWLVRYIEFKEAYEDGEKEAIQKMKKSIYEMGMGYEADGVAIVVGKTATFNERTGRKESEETEVIEHRYKKPVPKNAWAANRYLEIHDKAWKPQAASAVNNLNIQNNYNLGIYSEDELKALEKMGMSKLLEQNKIEESELK